MSKGRDAVTEIGASAMMDMDKLSKWLADCRVDPNDPANSELVYLLRVKLTFCSEQIKESLFSTLLPYIAAGSSISQYKAYRNADSKLHLKKSSYLFFYQKPYHYFFPNASTWDTVPNSPSKLSVICMH